MHALLKNFLYAVVFVLLWHMYQMDPDVAQLKDFLQLLHNDQVHGQIAVLTLFLYVAGGTVPDSVNRKIYYRRDVSPFKVDTWRSLIGFPPRGANKN